MPRISREAAALKETFVLGLFATNPTLTMKEVQEQVKAKFNQAMNATRILQLRDSLTKKDSPIVVAGQVEGETAVTPVATAPAETVPTPETETTFSPPTPIPAPEPLSATPGEPVVKVVEQVTTVDGTFVREPQPAKEGTDVTIRPGLVEVK